MKKLEKLFEIKYGVNLELNALKRCELNAPNAINFVSRSGKNNGISAYVERIVGLPPLPAGSISVAAGGSVLATFLQTKPYYSGRDLFYLVPKVEMSDNIKLFYCMCIRANRYRYNYGRQANRTLKEILVPDINEIPEEILSYPAMSIKDFSDSIQNQQISLPPLNEWKPFKLGDLFDIERGTGPRKQDSEPGWTPFVTAIGKNNGVSARINYIPMHQANTISVNRNGKSVAEAFYQEEVFCSTEDVHIFLPKFQMNKYHAMFINTLIRKEAYRYSYGRKWGIERMKASTINLPATDFQQPNWVLIEAFIKSLPFSASI